MNTQHYTVTVRSVKQLNSMLMMAKDYALILTSIPSEIDRFRNGAYSALQVYVNFNSQMIYVGTQAEVEKKPPDVSKMSTQQFLDLHEGGIAGRFFDYKKGNILPKTK